MATYYEEILIGRLMNRCALRGDEKACAVLDVYLAIGRIIARLKTTVDFEKELKEVGFSPPIGPEPPAPLGSDLGKDLSEFYVSDGDPDGAPARILPTAGLTNNPRRLQAGLKSAKLLRKGLLGVIETLDKDIVELEQKVKR